MTYISHNFEIIPVLFIYHCQCESSNNAPCMVRPTVFDLILVELNYYPFMINLDKFNGS